jgi:hypothetical protein
LCARDRGAGNQSAAANRHDQQVQVGCVFKDFERDRSRARDYVRMAVRRPELDAALRDILLR